jgi:ycgL
MVVKRPTSTNGKHTENGNTAIISKILMRKSVKPKNSSFINFLIRKEKNMKERILKIIKEIEEEKKVKVILVADTGSRSLGYSTSSSDYDIRFVYVQKPEKYLRLGIGKDTIERKADNFDFVGFDLRKALEMIRKSNIQMWQWFYSTQVILKTELSEKIKNLMPEFFVPKIALHQYAGISSNNFKRKIAEEENVKIKYYLLAVIRIATGLKIARDRKYPEIEHIDHIGDILPEKVYEEIKRILKIRTEFFLETVTANKILDCFIKENIEMLNTISDSIETKERNQAKLDDLFFEIVKDEIFKEYTVKEIFGC